MHWLAAWRTVTCRRARCKLLPLSPNDHTGTLLQLVINQRGRESAGPRQLLQGPCHSPTSQWVVAKEEVGEGGEGVCLAPGCGDGRLELVALQVAARRVEGSASSMSS